jgi:hypothetical protein
LPGLPRLPLAFHRNIDDAMLHEFSQAISDAFRAASKRLTQFSLADRYLAIVPPVHPACKFYENCSRCQRQVTKGSALQEAPG